MSEPVKPTLVDADLRSQAETILQDLSRKGAGQTESLAPEEIQTLLHELQVHQIELELQNEELRRAQVDLGMSRARYFDLYDLAPVGYCTLSEQGVILDANLTAASLLGAVRGALIKQPLSRFIHPEDADLYYQNWKRISKTGEPLAWDLRLVRRPGIIFWAHLLATDVQDLHGIPLYRLVFTDITEARQASETIRRMSVAVEQSPVSIMITDLTGAIDYVNPKFTEMSGFTLTEILGQNSRMLRAELHSQGVSKDLWDTITAGGTWRGEFHNKKKSGELFWEQASISPIRDERGVVTNFIAIKEDITARKKAEVKLRHEQAFSKSVLESLPGIFYLYTYPDLRMVLWNRRHESLFGFDSENLAGRHILDWYPQEGRAAALAAIP